MTAPHSPSQPGSATLTELADRCEKATGPDRGLDCLIFESQHLLLMPQHRGTIDGEPTGEYFDQGGNHLPERAPFFTGSIDAAMTLVSDDHFLLHIHQQPSGWVVKIGDKIDDHKEWESEGNTLANLVLKMRAALSPKEG